MKKQGCKMLMIMIAALLCLIFASGVILAKVFLPDTMSADASEEQQNSGESDVSAPYTAEDESVAPALYAPSAKSTAPILYCRHYNEKDFLKSVNGVTAATASSLNEPGEPLQRTVKGGISPHHLLAGRMIAEYFSALAQDPPATIILIGPNHKLIGVSGIHTSTTDWRTAYGTLEADDEISGRLIERMKAAENDSLMETEHSISSLVPYIKYYLPDSKIVPVLLHGKYGKEQSKELGRFLADIVSEKPDTVILASIDFSHYLDVIEADKMDEVTLAAIQSWNIDELSNMSNDNLDSTPTIITMLTAMDAIGAKDINVTGHSNSSKITGSGYDYTTSYYTMFFRPPD